MTDEDHSSDKIISGHDVNRFAEDAFRKGAEAMNNADLDKQVKLFGLIQMDAGLASMLSGVYNVFTNQASKLIGEHAYTITSKVGANYLHMTPDSMKLKRTAAVATFTADVILKSGGFIAPIFEGFSKHKKEQMKLARQLAPVLDDLKGNHSVGALSSIKASDNELIYAHRKRISRIAETQNLNNFLDMVVQAGPNIFMNVGDFRGMWRGETPQALEAIRQEHKKGHSLISSESRDGLINFASGPLSERWKKSNDHKLQKTLQPYSALEMILTLEEQVAAKPDASSFQAPGKESDSYPLEEYIMRILIQHQKDMADINPNHTELREALKDDMAAVAKPIAAAIRTGDMSPLALIRLVGEGKIIKKHGRAIASPAEVNSYIKRDAPKQSTYVHADPREYYKQATFTHDDLKMALGNLEGDEKRVFASMIPDAVLEDAGMKPDEIKKIREQTLKNYDRMLGETLVGLHHESPAALKQGGLAQKEIAHLNEAVEKIKEDGLQAVHALKSSPANANGVERDIINWAVPLVKGDKTHFGKVLAAGHAEFNSVASTVPKSEAKEDVEESKQDNDLSHVAREASRQAEQGAPARE